MKIKKYGIYHLSRKNSGSRYGHDIVVTKYDKKTKKVKYKNISSLEKIDKSGNIILKPNTIRHIKGGKITALPDSILNSKYWCGVWDDEREVDKDKIESKKFVKQKEIIGKYRKHLA